MTFPPQDASLDFLSRYPAGIYKTVFCAYFGAEGLGHNDRVRFERELNHVRADSEGYIATPGAFFEQWLRGRSGRGNGLLPDDDCHGFELQLPQARFEQEDDMPGVEDDTRIWGRIEGMVIASDLGYSGDFRNDLVFVMNDRLSGRTLVYHDADSTHIRAQPRGPKQLRHTSIYGWGGPPAYPFDSVNPRKSWEYTWSLVHVSHDEVYDALRAIGFVW